VAAVVHSNEVAAVDLLSMQCSIECVSTASSQVPAEHVDILSNCPVLFLHTDVQEVRFERALQERIVLAEAVFQRQKAELQDDAQREIASSEQVSVCRHT
jgi:hypothetical protein